VLGAVRVLVHAVVSGAFEAAVEVEVGGALTDADGEGGRTDSSAPSGSGSGSGSAAGSTFHPTPTAAELAAGVEGSRKMLGGGASVLKLAPADSTLTPAGAAGPGGLRNFLHDALAKVGWRGARRAAESCLVLLLCIAGTSHGSDTVVCGLGRHRRCTTAACAPL
jgi:hypothetical protein